MQKMKMDHHYYVYITASISEVIYTGVTKDLIKRIQQHKEKTFDGFTKKYHVDRLVYYEHYEYVNDAIHREKELKSWHRERKIALIESMNPEWKDLYDDLIK
jgi:putative endonuclease